MPSDSIYSGAPGAEGAPFDAAPAAGWGKRRKLLAGLGSLLLLAGTVAVVAATSHAGAPAVAPSTGGSATTDGSPAASAASLAGNKAGAAAIQAAVERTFAEPDLFSIKPAASKSATHGPEPGHEQLAQHLGYGFRVDADSPGFLATTMQLFALDEADVGHQHDGTAEGKIVYSTSDDTRAAKLSHEVGLQGTIGPFSAAVSQQVSSSSDRDIKTARLDVTQSFVQTRLTSTALSLYPETKLHPLAEQFIRDTPIADVGEISKMFGVFFARAVNRGGQVRMTYVMQVTKDDTQSSLVQEFGLRDKKTTKTPSEKETQAMNRRDCLSGDGQEGTHRALQLTGGGVSRHSSSSTDHCGAQHQRSWKALGGDPTKWMKKVGSMDKDGGETSVETMQNAWVESFTDDNMYTYVDPPDLRPIWEVVKKVDQAKGDALQELLLAEWGANGEDFRPTNFFGEITWATAFAVSGSAIDPNGDGGFNGAYVRTELECNGTPVYQNSDGYILFQPEGVADDQTVWKISHASSAALCRNDGWVVSRAGMCPTRPDDPDCTNNWLEWDRHHSYSEGPWKESSITVRESIQPRG